MRRNSRNAWLSLNHVDEDWWLFDRGSLTEFASSLTDPEDTFPTIIGFVGRQTKDAAMRVLFPNNNHGRSKKAGVASLGVDTTTADSEVPMLFVNINPDPVLDKTQHPENHAAEQRLRLEWATDSASVDQVAKRVQNELVLPFCDIVCYFADDFGADDVFQRFSSCGPECEQRRPVLAIVSRSKGVKTILRASDLARCFNGLRIVEIPDGEMSPQAQFMGLRDVVLHVSDTMRRAHTIEHTLFSASHLDAFFKSAKKHVAGSERTDFDFLRVSREGNEVSPDFKHHLQALLILGHEHGVMLDSLIKYVSSVMMVDSYPPGSHPFHPKLVFRTLYASACLAAYADHRDVTQNDAWNWCHLVERQFSEMYLRCVQRRGTSLGFHKACMSQGMPDVRMLRMNSECLFCLMRKSEHVLPCGHSMCNVCAVRFGQQARPEYYYRLAGCPLCTNSDTLIVKLVPPTAGARVLSIDGGGVRGEVSLLLLSALDAIRELEYPIQEEFDFAMGTSAGGLAVLQLFIKGMNSRDCVSMFDRLAHRIFVKRRRSSLPLCNWLLDMLATVISGARYDVERLESCLREAFGEEQRLYDTPETGPSGVKVAVTATTKRGKLCIISNYNGELCRDHSCGYDHIRPQDHRQELRVWEAAQITSAAPSIFPPKFVRGVGLLQDGGVGKHNNPVAPASWESQVALNATPDILISIGTGFSQQPATPNDPGRHQGFIRSNWIVRLFRAIWNDLSAEGKHIDHQNHLDEEARGRYFRFNVPLDIEPALDDITKMQELRLATAAYIQDNSHSLIAVKDAFRAASFFFELRESPVHDGLMYNCSGFVRCRSSNTSALLQALARDYPRASFKTNTDVTLGKLVDGISCPACGAYRKELKFRVHSLQHKISILLCFDRLHERKIGGFPNSVAWFQHRQHLEAPFGRPDHLRSADMFNRECNCIKPKVGVKRKPLHEVDGMQIFKKSRVR